MTDNLGKHALTIGEDQVAVDSEQNGNPGDLKPVETQAARKKELTWQETLYAAIPQKISLHYLSKPVITSKYTTSFSNVFEVYRYQYHQCRDEIFKK